MKKIPAFLAVLFLMLCTAFPAYADEISPVEETARSLWPILLVAVAVIAVAVILWKLFKRK